jgi:hypothetical protein
MIIDTGLNRMPTRREVEEYYGDSRLGNAISKRNLWFPLAKELHLESKPSRTNFGRKYELKFMDYIENKGYEAIKMSTKHPYDILVNECVKVDVKASTLYRGRNGSFYTFNLEKIYPTCDIYILYILSDDEKVLDVLVIPSKDVIGISQISLGEHSSKYYKYSNKWSYIKRYCDFIKTLN